MTALINASEKQNCFANFYLNITLSHDDLSAVASKIIGTIFYFLKFLSIYCFIFYLVVSIARDLWSYSRISSTDFIG